MRVGREELRAVANLYSDIKATRSLSKEEDAQMTQTFDAHIGCVMSLLDKRLLAVPPEAVVARRAESCLAEHGAFDVCFQGVTRFAFSEGHRKNFRRLSKCCPRRTS